MCRLDRISAHLETPHCLTWICRDQNPSLSASCEVGELSAGITPRCSPDPGAGIAGAQRVGLCWWQREAVTASLGLCQVALVLPGCPVLCPSQVPQNSSDLLLGGRGSSHHREGVVCTSLLEFPTRCSVQIKCSLGFAPGSGAGSAVGDPRAHGEGRICPPQVVSLGLGAAWGWDGPVERPRSPPVQGGSDFPRGIF